MPFLRPSCAPAVANELNSSIFRWSGHCNSRDVQDIAVEYNVFVIYPDKVRINLYYLHHYPFIKDTQMIFCTVLGKKMMYNNEEI